MRAKDSVIFEEIYNKIQEQNPYEKKSACYELAEDTYFYKNGKRKYKEYANFRSVISRRRRKKTLSHR